MKMKLGMLFLARRILEFSQPTATSVGALSFFRLLLTQTIPCQIIVLVQFFTLIANHQHRANSMS